MPAVHTLVTKLEGDFELDPTERAAIAALPNRLVTLQSEEPIHRVGERPDFCVVILDGIVFSSREIEDGKRQIMSFYVSGDVPDLRTLHLGVMDCDVMPAGPARVAKVAHEDLRGLMDGHPRIGAALWRSTMVVGSIYRQWIVNIGHRQALVRLAHLFCELFVRLQTVGLASDGRCELPLTQAHLGAATGLSAVHLNRTLQELRRRGLVSFSGGVLRIPDLQALAAVANFSEGYLHLPARRARAA